MDKKAHPWSEGAECGFSRFYIIHQPHKCSAYAALPPFPYLLNTIASHFVSYSHYSIYRTYQTTQPLNTSPLNHHQMQNTQSLRLRLPKRTVPETITFKSKPSSSMLALLRMRLLYSLVLLLIKSNMPYAIDLRLKKTAFWPISTPRSCWEKAVSRLGMCQWQKPTDILVWYPSNPWLGL